jgi:Tol biopolymer transport system component
MISLLRTLAIWTLIALWGAAVLPAHAQADPPLVGPAFAFVSAEQDALYLYDVGTGFTRRLAPTTGWLNVWGFVEGGCRVVYTAASTPTAPARLYSVRLDGSDPRLLVQFNDLPPDQWGVWEPQPSPDGAQIAFVLLRAASTGEYTYTHHLAVIPASGGVPVLYSRTGDEHEPEWSPDSRWITYMSYSGRVPGADPVSTAVPTPEGQPVNPAGLLHEADLWVVSADGSTKYRLTDFPVGSVRAPRWSPDGYLVSFVYSPTPNNEMFFMIGAAEGALPTPLSAGTSLILDTTWFPDSTALLASARGLQSVAENVLWRVPLVGAAESDASRVLADVPYADYPRFSADGGWLTFRTEYGLGLADVRSAAWSLLDMPAGNMPPVWTPAAFAGERACG